MFRVRIWPNYIGLRTRTCAQVGGRPPTLKVTKPITSRHLQQHSEQNCVTYTGSGGVFRGFGLPAWGGGAVRVPSGVKKRKNKYGASDWPRGCPRAAAVQRRLYRCTSPIRNSAPLGPYSSTMLRVLGGSLGAWACSDGRGTPVGRV